MESLIDHIINERDLDERTAERIILNHNWDYVELAGPLTFRLKIYAHNPDYSIWILLSDFVVNLDEGETYIAALSEPVDPVDGAEYRDIYITAEEPRPSKLPLVLIGIGAGIVGLLGLVYFAQGGK